MPPRPEGTDGSDHGYRMVIENRYKSMVWLKEGLIRLLPVHIILSILKTAFFLLPMAAGYNVGIIAWFFPIVEFMMVSFWLSARVGAARESLVMLKGCSSCLILILAVSFIVMYSYHTMTEKHLMVHELSAGVVSKWIDQDAEWTRASLEKAHTLCDMTFLFVCMITAYCAHMLTTLKMDQRKQRSRDSKKDE